jgi:hypothetical protein
MAKVPSSVIKISGKLDGKVHEQNKGVYIIRDAPKTTGRKSDEFNRQKDRTALINNFASELNRIMPLYAESLGRKTFYERLKTAFRKEPLDNRFLMLRQLKGMEINIEYPLSGLGEFATTVSKQKDEILVELKVLRHPLNPVYDANCYYYEVTLLCWDKTTRPAIHSRQLSDWVKLKDECPVFEFAFPKPLHVTHWLLCVKVILGVNNYRIESFEGEGMQLFDIGSFDKTEMAMLKQKEPATLMQPLITGKKVDEAIRVKAKKDEEEGDLKI